MRPLVLTADRLVGASVLGAIALVWAFLVAFDFALKVPLDVKNHVRQHVVGVALDRFVDVASRDAVPCGDAFQHGLDGRFGTGEGGRCGICCGHGPCGCSDDDNQQQEESFHAWPPMKR